MRVKRLALLGSLLSLLLVACQSNSLSIDTLATELASEPSTPTTEASATPAPTATLSATPLPSVSVFDGTNDCVTVASLDINCNPLQRDVTDLVLVSDGQTLTVTVSIQGQPWEQFPDQFVSFQFDTDSDVATGSRTLGVQHGIGTDTNVFWGWTSASLPFGIERYDELGDLTDSSGEREEFVTILDNQTLQLSIPLELVGSDSFNFVFNLQAPPGVGILDTVPEPGAALSFPSGALTGEP